MAGWAAPLVLSLFVTGVVFQSQFSLRCLNSSGLPGRPFQSVHFVEFATCCAARIASHSVGATTPTRLPLTTTCPFGNFVLSNSPGRPELRSERLRMHHAGMHHLRKPDIGRPFLSRGHLRRNDGVL